ncbi:MAG: 23S rRNA (adenine(2030)-N(6))-methyltransferase RlmJ [Pseudomonadota bacterium]|nr:23S rRNA (adenine(2030)-N(6))-methyltransferase RlmJ [Pseudomonadota bacterium]QKK05794.1 MAG: 23S rRNA (adenine(2030)-N(6))-methyltransferase RlmJ [Pseudomonadota bacterium]
MSLSYQHIYHAGNPADIHKHLWLMAVLRYMTRKDKPLFWADTHAGRGLYDLSSKEAAKTAEAAAGIQKLLAAKIDHVLWQDYVAQIKKYNPRGGLGSYPGSAILAAMLLRRDDRLSCFELHPQEFTHLQNSLKKYRHSHAEKQDGLRGLGAYMPPPQKRGGALIDPSYEIKTDYEAVPQALARNLKKFPQGVFMVWYPLLPAGRHEILKEQCAALEAEVLIDEWIYADPAAPDHKGMYGSGMVIINPPYTVPETMGALKEIILPLLR